MTYIEKKKSMSIRAEFISVSEEAQLWRQYWQAHYEKKSAGPVARVCQRYGT